MRKFRLTGQAGILFGMLLLPFFPAAQSGCPGCVVTLPDSLAADTIYLAAAPNGRVGEPYAADISFRVPRTTTPVAAVDSTTPPGITIQRITINTVTNVPAGLDWEVSQKVFDLPAQTDGCVRFCGTPLQPGLYLVEVVVTARVFIIDETTSFSFPLLIEPAQRITEGFTMRNNVGCGEVEVDFSNNLPSGGRNGFSYYWDFGNGNSSLAEQPPPQLYRTPGRYPVHYQAVVDTSGYFLTNVRVDRVSCSDPFNNAPDLQVKVYNPAGEEIYASDIRDNRRPPLDFGLNIPLDTGNYLVEVLDDEGAIFGKSICGTFNFSRQTQGSLADAQAGVTLTILHPVDTVRSADTVIVYRQPAPPVVRWEGTNPVCAGDTVRLFASYDTNLEWYRDSVVIPETGGPELLTTQGGSYWVSYTSDDGCRATSAAVPVSIAPRPVVPVLFVERNLLYLAESPPLPANYRLDWRRDGEPLPYDGRRSFCLDRSGTYTAVLTDLSTGCVQERSLAITYDPAFPGCVSGVETFDRLAGEVSLFPNPTAGAFTLSLRPAAAADLHWLLFNARGQMLRHGEQRLAGGEATVGFDISDLPAGMYWLQVQIDGAGRGFPVVRR